MVELIIGALIGALYGLLLIAAVWALIALVVDD